MTLVWQRTVMIMCVLAASSPAAAQPVGAVVVVSEPSDAEIFVDGKSIGKAPAQAELLPGEHLLQAKWSDGRETSQTVTIESGASKVVKLASTTAPPTPTTPPAPVTDSKPAPAAEVTASLTVLDQPVRNPLHPQLRGGISFAPSLGLFCLMSNSTGLGTGCAPELRLAASGRRKEFHLKVARGGNLVIGGKLGFGLGTRARPLESAPRVTWAFRVDIDLMVFATSELDEMPFVAGSDLASYAVCPVPGVNFAIGVTRDLTVDLRGALGPYVGLAPPCLASASDTCAQSLELTYGWLFNLQAGVRL